MKAFELMFRLSSHHILKVVIVKNFFFENLSKFLNLKHNDEKLVEIMNFPRIRYSMFARTIIRFRCTSVVGNSSKEIAKVLSRIQVIENENECSEITQKIIAQESPIGVDAEGITDCCRNRPVGMIQVGTKDNEIYLFRTGVNSKLITKGGLKELMDSNKVLKIMHDATMDSLSFHQSGMPMRALYDTSLAHKIIQFQNNGIPFHGGNTVSFNNLCREFSLVTNPLKDEFDGYKWVRMDKKLRSGERLEDNFLVYCAYDVIPLIDLYHTTNKLIDTDFRGIFEELCENHLIRPIDRLLVRTKQKQYLNQMQRGIFLSSLKKSVTKYNIHSFLRQFNGEKKLFFSPINKTAHCIVENRAKACEVVKAIQTDKKAKTLLGGKVESTLLKPDTPAIVCHEWDPQTDASKIESYFQGVFVTDQQFCHKIVEALIKARSPVVVQFSRLLHLNASATALEIFVGQSKVLKFDLSNEGIVQSLGPLMSAADTPKVVPKLSSSEFQSSIGIFQSFGFSIRNFFDIQSATEVCDYFFEGKSLFKSPQVKVKDLCMKYDIQTTRWKSDNINLYLHLSNMLPKDLVSLFEDLMEMQFKYINDKKGLKGAKSELYENLEKSTLHVSVVKEFSDFNQFVERNLGKIGHKVLFATDCTMIVKIQHDQNLEKAILRLTTAFSEMFPNSNIDFRVNVIGQNSDTAMISRNVMAKNDKMVNIRQHYMKNLENAGFFSLLDEEFSLPQRSAGFHV